MTFLNLRPPMPEDLFGINSEILRAAKEQLEKAALNKHTSNWEKSNFISNLA